MKVIGLCGYSATGKTTVAGLLRDRIPGSTIVSSSSAVREMLREKGSDLNADNMMAMHDQLLKEYGSNYAQLFIARMRSSTGPILFDSFRRAVDVEYVKARAQSLTLLWIQCDTHQARSRTQLRARFDGEVANFGKVRAREKSHGVEELKGLCEVAVDNSGSINVLDQQLSDFVATYGSRP